MFRHFNQNDLSPKLLLRAGITLAAVSSLIGCDSQPRTGLSNGQSSTSTGFTASTSSSVPSSAQPELPIAGHSEAPQSPTAPNPSGPAVKSSLLSPHTVQIPSDLAQPASPTAGTPIQIPKMPVLRSGKNTPSGAAQPVPSNLPLQAPNVSFPADRSPTAIPDSSSKSSAALTEEAKLLNQPLEPRLQLPTASSSKASQPPSQPTFSGSSSLPSSNASDSGSSTRSNPSGLRPLEYKYNPSTGVYSTSPAE